MYYINMNGSKVRVYFILVGADHLKLIMGVLE